MNVSVSVIDVYQESLHLFCAFELISSSQIPSTRCFVFFSWRPKQGYFKRKRKKERETNFSVNPSLLLAGPALPRAVVLHTYTHTETAVLPSAGIGWSTDAVKRFLGARPECYTEQLLQLYSVFRSRRHQKAHGVPGNLLLWQFSAGF